ncbi:MAG: TraR/DksA family transcriptional regulator [Pseudomonadota bacterium]
MTDPQAYKRRLETRLQELSSRLHHIEDELEEPVSGNWDEAATEREDNEVLEEMGQEGLREVRAIRATLKRIEHGTFGTCAECGEPISAERLEVVPHTALCRNCAV